MTREEEYQQVFGVKPKKPRKTKVAKTAKKTKQPELAPIAPETEEPVAWNYIDKKSIASNPKDRKNLHFLLGLVIVFVALLILSAILRLFR